MSLVSKTSGINHLEVWNGRNRKATYGQIQEDYNCLQEVRRDRILMHYIGESTRIEPGHVGRVAIRTAGEIGDSKPGPGLQEL